MSDPAAYHEFGMFGRDRVYLSHYPMFHAVHAYQAIIEVELRERGRDWSAVFFDDRRRHPTRFYTLSPSKKGSPLTRRRADWPLPSTVRAGARFNADVHWGSRVNQFLGRDVTVTVRRVFHLRQFQESDRRNKELSYIVFGRPKDLYLAHYISVPPDFDQIVSAEVAAGELPAGRFQLLRVRRPDRKTTRLRREGQIVDGRIVALAGPGSSRGREYPAVGPGRARAQTSGAKVRLRILGEQYYSELDEEA